MSFLGQINRRLDQIDRDEAVRGYGQQADQAIDLLASGKSRRGLFGSCPCAAVLSAESVAEQDHAVHQGQKFPQAVDGVQAPSEAVLGRHLWARGYFVASSGNVTDEAIIEYIRQQEGNEPSDGGDNFQIPKS